MREPVSEIRILLPVWGERYVEQFLRYCLPTLLADGNLPALRRRAPCAFVLFTCADDVQAIRSNAFFRVLASLCAVEIEVIDDLIGASHSTTITVAYARGVRARASKALETCFIFLVADYVFADGALNNAVARIVGGSSGVLVGNCQIASEGAAPLLREALAGKSCLSIAPRELVRLALHHLHPSTLANFADAAISHDPSSNRLFWRVDESTILGRFYLLHMIAIRPETVDFVIAAPSDYALIPELCPSGAVVTIEDSDEYCVVELQPRGEKPPNLRFGPLTPEAVAAPLRIWATRQHRENARHALVFHCGRESAALPEKIAASQRFVDAVERLLPTAAQPFRHHPYWPRAIDHHVRSVMTPVDFRALVEALGDRDLAAATKSTRSVRLRSVLLGHAPSFRLWHPRWPDARRFWTLLGRVVNGASTIVAGDLPATLREDLVRKMSAMGARRIGCITLSEVEGLPGSAERDRFDCGVLIVPARYRENCWPIAERLASRIRPGGRFIVAIGDAFDESAPALTADALPRQPLSMLSRLRLEEASFVAASATRASIQSAMMASARASLGGSARGAVARLANAAILATFSAGLNVVAFRRRSASGVAQCSSIFLLLRVMPPGADAAASKASDADTGTAEPAACGDGGSPVFRL